MGIAPRLRRLLEPPLPLIRNSREPRDFPLGRWNLYIGGAGASTPGYVNVDLFARFGVDVVADAHHLPFRAGTFTRVECDAVLEHVREPAAVVREIGRVLEAGGHAHLVTPFCHPFHEYPRDFHRFTPDGLRLLLTPELEAVAEGWRTGPTATLLVFVLEYAKLLLPYRVWRMAIHFVLGWLLSPLRYLDLLLLRAPQAGRIGNHCFLWVRKRTAAPG
jgi:SAM-dependent methyltransferase